MKNLKAIWLLSIIGFLLSLQVCAQDNLSNVINGDKLYESCKLNQDTSGLKSHHVTVDILTDQAEAYGFCAGIIYSSSQALMMLDKNNVCFPSNISNLVIEKIIIKWGDDHPERLDDPVFKFFKDALESVYKCPR